MVSLQTVGALDANHKWRSTTTSYQLTWELSRLKGQSKGSFLEQLVSYVIKITTYQLLNNSLCQLSERELWISVMDVLSQFSDYFSVSFRLKTRVKPT